MGNKTRIKKYIALSAVWVLLLNPVLYPLHVKAALGEDHTYSMLTAYDILYDTAYDNVTFVVYEGGTYVYPEGADTSAGDMTLLSGTLLSAQNVYIDTRCKTTVSGVEKDFCNTLKINGSLRANTVHINGRVDISSTGKIEADEIILEGILNVDGSIIGNVSAGNGAECNISDNGKINGNVNISNSFSSGKGVSNRGRIDGEVRIEHSDGFVNCFPSENICGYVERIVFMQNPYSSFDPNENIGLTDETFVENNTGSSVRVMVWNSSQLSRGEYDIESNRSGHIIINDTNLNRAVNLGEIKKIEDAPAKEISFANDSVFPFRYAIEFPTDNEFTIDSDFPFAEDGNTIYYEVEPNHVLNLRVGLKSDCTKKGKIESKFMIKPEGYASLSGTITVTAEISEDKVLKDGSGSVEVSKAYFGGKYDVKISSPTNDASKAVIKYKNKSTGNYLNGAPSGVGNYLVEVTFPANDEYKELVLSKDFSIEYLPTPSVAATIEGEKGDNDFYITDITIIPAEGYLISKSINGPFAEFLTLGEEQNVRSFYLKKSDTGEITDAVSISDYKIDNRKPQVSDVEEGEEYYSDDFSFDVSDDNLAKVTLNGEEINFIGKTCKIYIDPDGDTLEYVLVCTDKAGHTETKTFVVSALWLKNKTVVPNKNLKLKANVKYKLPTGNWKVKRPDGNFESTVYKGGYEIMVDRDTELIFINE